MGPNETPDETLTAGENEDVEDTFEDLYEDPGEVVEGSFG